jgi:magnesium transporter
MNQLEYTGSHKKVRVRCSCSSDYTEYDDFEISDFKTGINVKKTNWLNLTRLKRNGNYRRIGDFFKIDNFSAFGYIKYKQKN